MLPLLFGIFVLHQHSKQPSVDHGTNVLALYPGLLTPAFVVSTASDKHRGKKPWVWGYQCTYYYSW